MGKGRCVWGVYVIEGVGLTDGVSVSDDGEPVPAVPAREAEVARCRATAAR